jgi:SulP family sulfate permease
VGYIPVPVGGGYLACIGYFCLQAGVALCISKPMATLSDWALLLDAHNLMLAVPGLATGLLLLWTAKNATSGSTLPILMCALPACFYAFLYARGFATGFRNGDVFVEAREAGWVGKETGMVVTPQAVFGLLDLSKVRERRKEGGERRGRDRLDHEAKRRRC